MAHVTADRVRDTSTTTGTGAFSVSGTAPTGYRTFSAVLSTSDTCWYAIQHQTAAEWEVGLGTYSSLNTITRTTVLASSNAGSAVNFSAGTKDIFITLAATKTVQQDNSGAVTIDANSSSDALRVTQTGAGNALLVEDSANPDSSPFVINASGNVGIGTTAPDALLTVNTIASFGDGAAATPSIAHKGDLNTGFWFPAADTIAASTAGTERMRITSAGTVLIGTTTATGNVISTGNTDSTTTSITNQYHQYNSGATSGSGTKTGSNILMVALPAYAGTGAWLAYNGGMTNQSPNTVSQFRSFNASYVTTGGGTLSNYYGYFANDTTLTSGTVTNTYGFYGNIASGTGKFNVYAAGTANNYFAGNVGIGTASPDALLTVNTIASFGDGAAATPSIAHKGDLNTGFWFPAADTIAASTAGTERMRIDSSGNVGIGQNYGLQKLTVAGQSPGGNGAYATNQGSIVLNETGRNSVNDAGGLEFKASVFGSGYGAKIIGMDNGSLAFGWRANSATFTESVRIDISGNVGVGTTAFGSGAVVIGIANATTVPSTNPSGGGVLYVEGGALKYRGSSGTITTIANA